MDSGVLSAWLGVVAAVAALPLALIIYRLQKKTKKLVYKVTSSDLRPTEASVPLQVVHGSRPLTEPRLVLVTFINAGSAEIRAGDFEEPVRITFTDKTKIESVAVSQSKPHSLGASTILESDESIQLQPLLLNPEDRFTLELLVDGQGSAVNVSGRVAGVKELLNISPTSEPKSSISFRRPILVIPVAIAGLLATFILIFFAAALAVQMYTPYSYSDSNNGYGEQAAMPTPPFGDGADSKTTQCESDANLLEEVPIADANSRRIGTLRLMKSNRCQTAWATASFQERLVSVTVVKVVRPHDARAVSNTFNLGVEEGSYESLTDHPSGMLDVNKDCAQAEITITLGEKSVEVKTKCRG